MFYKILGIGFACEHVVAGCPTRQGGSKMTYLRNLLWNCSTIASAGSVAGDWAVDAHGELLEAPELYEKFKAFLGNFCVDLHAIYDRGGSSNHPECSCAAADIFQPGMTYKNYLTLTDDGQIFVEDLQRWFFG